MTETKEEIRDIGKIERRVRVCFKCREYVNIPNNNPRYEVYLRNFDSMHHLHPVQTVNKSELLETRSYEKPYIKRKLIEFSKKNIL